MLFESIIITGTSCAGKSTITKELCNIGAKDGRRFEQVPAITTRKKRVDDTNYEFVSSDEFERCFKCQELMTNSSYREERYGIKRSEYNKIVEKGNVPILIITSSAAAELLALDEEKYMCIFIDTLDQLLMERWIKRLGDKPREEERKKFIKQNEKDRAYQNKAHYILNNLNVQECVELIILLWEIQNQGGALSEKLIERMIRCGVLLRNADLEMINGASYDLRLGDEYYYQGEIRKLSKTIPFLTIEPYDYAIVSCKEIAWIPRDVVAKFGLTVGLFCQGIILSNGPQVDPGFRGTLFCLLFNTSNRAVHLKRGKHYATIEFNKLIGCAKPYEGQYQGKTHIIDYIPENALHGAINELKKEVEQLKTENRVMQNIYLGVVALMFAIVSILLVIKG